MSDELVLVVVVTLAGGQNVGIAGDALCRVQRAVDVDRPLDVHGALQIDRSGLHADSVVGDFGLGRSDIDGDRTARQGDGVTVGLPVVDQ